MPRKRYRWHWGRSERDEDLFEPKADDATFILPDKLTTLHPRLRHKKLHNHLWTSLGHEFVHALFSHNGSTPQREKLAYKLENTAGLILHDFYHRFRKTGLPTCTKEYCDVINGNGKKTKTKKRSHGKQGNGRKDDPRRKGSR